MQRFLLTILTALCLTLGITQPAKAVNVTVGGVIYDITLSAPNITYDSVEATLISTPWFGNQALASSIAGAYFPATGGDFGITSGTSDRVYFAFADIGPGIQFQSRAAIEGLPLSGEFGPTISANQNDLIGSTRAFAFGTIVGTVAVPEINGASLAQALFVLTALGLILMGRRRGAFA